MAQGTPATDARSLRLESPRLVVRLALHSDAPEVVRFYRENDDFFSTTQNRTRPELLELDSVERQLALRRADYEAGRACQLFAFARDRPREVVAAVNFTAFVRGYFQACYLGYAVAEHAEGRGLMQEALTLGLGHVFGALGLHRVMANYAPENKRSGALLRRLGFRIEGYAERYLMIHGEWRDHFMTALHAEDWWGGRAERAATNSAPT